LGALALAGVLTASLLLYSASPNAIAQQSAQPADSPGTLNASKSEARLGSPDSKRVPGQSISSNTSYAGLVPLPNLAPATNVSNAGDKRESAEFLHDEALHDVGTATPAALVQTWMWATGTGDTNRLAQLLAFDPETQMDNVQQMLREIRA